MIADCWLCASTNLSNSGKMAVCFLFSWFLPSVGSLWLICPSCRVGSIFNWLLCFAVFPFLVWLCLHHLSLAPVWVGFSISLSFRWLDTFLTLCCCFPLLLHDLNCWLARAQKSGRCSPCAPPPPMFQKVGPTLMLLLVLSVGATNLVDNTCLAVRQAAV